MRLLEQTIARWLGLACAALATACAPTSSVECPDGSTCGAGTRCVLDPGLPLPAQEPGYRCVTAAELAACDGKADRAGCTTSGPGTCVEGVCYAAVCGDGITDITEACDDRNLIGGDGCADDCASAEQCGDQIVDVDFAEQCDVGAPGLSGDGCTGNCYAEYRLWREVPAPTPPLRQVPGLVPDPRGRGVLLIGGGAFAGIGQADNVVFGDMWRWDGLTWLPVAQPQRPPDRGAAAIAYDAVRGRVVMFGGFGADFTAFGDTWEWDGTTWTQRTPATAPPPRAHASMACGGGRCVLFGGRRADPATLRDDTWVWDGATWTELPGVAHPSARSNAALTFDPVRQRIVLYGGILTGGDTIGETWTLGATGGWRRLADAFDAPEVGRNLTIPRALYQGGQVLLAVGTGNAALAPLTTTLWRLGVSSPGGIETATWTQVTNGQTDALLAIAVDPTRDLLVGLASEDLAVAESAGAAWTEVRPVDPGLSGIAATTAAYDRLRARTLVVGPAGTLSWNGRGFERLVAPDAPTAPPVSTGAILAYDTRCDQAILFGGLNTKDGVLHGQTWRFAAGAWTQVTSSGPSARALAMMTYDEAQAKVVLFGGVAGGDAPLDDLWELSATDCAAPTWTQVTLDPAAPQPPPRGAGTLTYDPTRAASVLYGGARTDGFAAIPGLQRDTWLLDRGPAAPATWTQLAGPGGPGPRTGHGATFEPGHGHVILMGGTSNAGTEIDTWALGDSGEWARVDVVVAPVGRTGLTLVRDPLGLLAIGGVDRISSKTGEVMMSRLTSEQVIDPPERCLAATDDADGDQRLGCDDPDCWTRCDPTCVPTLTSATTCAQDRPRCGDQRCDAPREDYALCPTDCTPPGL